MERIERHALPGQPALGSGWLGQNVVLAGMNEHACLMARLSIRRPTDGLVLALPERPLPATRVAPAVVVLHMIKLLLGMGIQWLSGLTARCAPILGVDR